MNLENYANVITRESVYFSELMCKIKTMETEIDLMKENNLSCVDKWMNGETVMKKLGVSRRTLQTYRDTGILKYSAIGSKFYYNIRDIEKLMRDNYVSTGT